MKRIPLSQGLVALVDDEDYERVMAAGKWHARRRARGDYAGRNFYHGGRGRIVLLHTFLTGWPLVDHINGDGLDNRRANLRPATHAENNQNRKRGKNNTSGFKGVSPFKTRYGRTRWRATISVNRRKVSLGLYDDAEDAAHAYDAAALLYFGEFARLNFAGGEES